MESYANIYFYIIVYVILLFFILSNNKEKTAIVTLITINILLYSNLEIWKICRIIIGIMIITQLLQLYNLNKIKEALYDYPVILDPKTSPFSAPSYLQTSYVDDDGNKCGSKINECDTDENNDWRQGVDGLKFILNDIASHWQNKVAEDYSTDVQIVEKLNYNNKGYYLVYTIIVNLYKDIKDRVSQDFIACGGGVSQPSTSDTEFEGMQLKIDKILAKINEVNNIIGEEKINSIDGFVGTNTGNNFASKIIKEIQYFTNSHLQIKEGYDTNPKLTPQSGWFRVKIQPGFDSTLPVIDLDNVKGGGLLCEIFDIDESKYNKIKKKVAPATYIKKCRRNWMGIRYCRYKQTAPHSINDDTPKKLLNQIHIIRSKNSLDLTGQQISNKCKNWYKYQREWNYGANRWSSRTPNQNDYRNDIFINPMAIINNMEIMNYAYKNNEFNSITRGPTMLATTCSWDSFKNYFLFITGKITFKFYTNLTSHQNYFDLEFKTDDYGCIIIHPTNKDHDHLHKGENLSNSIVLQTSKWISGRQPVNRLHKTYNKLYDNERNHIFNAKVINKNILRLKVTGTGRRMIATEEGAEFNITIMYMQHHGGGNLRFRWMSEENPTFSSNIDLHDQEYKPMGESDVHKPGILFSPKTTYAENRNNRDINISGTVGSGGAWIFAPINTPLQENIDIDITKYIAARDVRYRPGSNPVVEPSCHCAPWNTDGSRAKLCPRCVTKHCPDVDPSDHCKLNLDSPGDAVEPSCHCAPRNKDGSVAKFCPNCVTKNCPDVDPYVHCRIETFRSDPPEGFGSNTVDINPCACIREGGGSVGDCDVRYNNKTLVSIHLDGLIDKFVSDIEQFREFAYNAYYGRVKIFREHILILMLKNLLCNVLFKDGILLNDENIYDTYGANDDDWAEDGKIMNSNNKFFTENTYQNGDLNIDGINEIASKSDAVAQRIRRKLYNNTYNYNNEITKIKDILDLTVQFEMKKNDQMVSAETVTLKTALEEGIYDGISEYSENDLKFKTSLVNNDQEYDQEEYSNWEESVRLISSSNDNIINFSPQTARIKFNNEIYDVTLNNQHCNLQYIQNIINQATELDNSIYKEPYTGKVEGFQVGDAAANPVQYGTECLDYYNNSDSRLMPEKCIVNEIKYIINNNNNDSWEKIYNALKKWFCTNDYSPNSPANFFKKLDNVEFCPARDDPPACPGENPYSISYDDGSYSLQPSFETKKYIDFVIDFLELYDKYTIFSKKYKYADENNIINGPNGLIAIMPLRELVPADKQQFINDLIECKHSTFEKVVYLKQQFESNYNSNDFIKHRIDKIGDPFNLPIDEDEVKKKVIEIKQTENLLVNYVCKNKLYSNKYVPSIINNCYGCDKGVFDNSLNCAAEGEFESTDFDNLYINGFPNYII